MPVLKEVKPKDGIWLLTVPKGTTSEAVRGITDGLIKGFPENSVLVVPRGTDLKALSEREMRKHGWVRAGT